MSGASAAGASASGPGSSAPSAGGGPSSYASSGAPSGGSSQSSSRGGSHTLGSTASIDLSQESFTQRSVPIGTHEGVSRAAEAIDVFSTLSVPGRPSAAARDATLAQELSSARQASNVSRQGLTVAVEAESRAEQPATMKGGRPGATLAEATHQNAHTKSSQERSHEAEKPAGRDAAFTMNLEGEAFSATLSSCRGDSQQESVEQPAHERREREDPKMRVDEEERLTQYYRKVLDGLVASNMITEDLASVARGKRGMDLVAAVGEVVSRAEAQKQEMRVRQDEVARTPFSTHSSSQASDGAARQRSSFTAQAA